MPAKKEAPPPSKDSCLPPQYRGELKRRDVSIHPSYTKLVVPYSVICRQRYMKNSVLYRAQLMRELLFQESLQTNALDGMRLHREFAQGVLFVDETKIPYLSKRQKIRLENIIESK